jgi:hypothetical protein
MIKIICENVGPLRPVAILMSGSAEAEKPKSKPAAAKPATA